MTGAFKNPSGEAGKLTRDQAHQFWKNPNRKNQPDRYAAASPERSLALVTYVQRLVPPTAKILEIGCNTGRNLHYLYQAGYQNLSAIEINANAVTNLRNVFPDTAGRAAIKVGPAEETLPAFRDQEFDLVFSMAVLVHIHPDSDHIFTEMARITRKVLVLEDEKTTDSERHYPRDYNKVFTNLNYKEVFYEPNIPGLGAVYVGRAFERQS